MTQYKTIYHKDYKPKKVKIDYTCPEKIHDNEKKKKREIKYDDYFEVIDKPINLHDQSLKIENRLKINTIKNSLNIPNIDMRPSYPGIQVFHDYGTGTIHPNSFASLKNKDYLQKQESVWKKICDELGWKFA